MIELNFVGYLNKFRLSDTSGHCKFPKTKEAHK